MKIKEIISSLEELAPLAYTEDFDNTGLLIGNENVEVTGILITLDTLESVVDEAIQNKCNLIISFHPIIFSGLKKITGKNYVERVAQKSIKHDIAIFAIHTALDNAWNGVNAMISKKLGLKNKQILIPQKGAIKKLVTYVPVSNADTLREAIFASGGGSIGNYSNCSFNSVGKGTFRGNEKSNPTKGKKGETNFEDETRISITFLRDRENAVLKALFSNHPYEEIAYEISTLENTNQHIGMGMMGELNEPMAEKEFLNFLKKTMITECVRHSHYLDKPVKKIAVLGGSGSFAIDAAKAAGADVFVSADFKYHDFFKAENKILLADIGHYESEQFTKEILHSFLKEKNPNFAILLSQVNTNPISYL